jgi:hypothetical protein
LELSHKLNKVNTFINSENVYVDKINKSQSESNVSFLNINDDRDVDSLRQSRTHQDLISLIEVITFFYF